MNATPRVATLVARTLTGTAGDKAKRSPDMHGSYDDPGMGPSAPPEACDSSSDPERIIGSPLHKSIALSVSDAPHSESSDRITALGDKTLFELEQQIEAAYLSRAGVPYERVVAALEPLRARLGKRFDEVFEDARVLATYPALHSRIVGETTLADYATAEPSLGVIAWWQEFIESAEGLIQRGLADSVLQKTTSTASHSRDIATEDDGQVSTPDDGAESFRKHLLDVDRELDEITDRLSSELRARRPDLFDALGRPKIGALAKAVQKRTGKKKLSQADIRALLRKKSS
jgi:hypothetical protein